MAGNSLSVYLLVSVKKLQPKLKQPGNCICPLNAVETINKKKLFYNLYSVAVLEMQTFNSSVLQMVWCKNQSKTVQL